MSEEAQKQDPSDDPAVRPSIHVEVWFDVRCPWCYLGKRRLERAIELFAADGTGVPVTVSHRSFELAPGANHIMLIGLTRPLLAGDEVSVTLTFSDGTEVALTAMVKDYTGANEEYAPGGHEQDHDEHDER